jgi:uncharacterized protein YndB with AHSA1/START domain
MSSDTVHRSITVSVPVERAFAVFTEGLGGWWPPELTWAADDLAGVELEGRQGGRWLERDRDGREAAWGEVLAWDPPRRVVLSWAVNADRSPQPDPDRRSEIDVTFTPEDDRTTRVDVEHRGLARHGGDTDAYVEGMGPGWEHLLERYRAAAGGAE